MTCDKFIGQTAMSPIDFVTDLRDCFKFIPVLQRRPNHRIAHAGHQLIQGVLEEICHTTTGEISCAITKVLQLVSGGGFFCGVIRRRGFWLLGWLGDS